MVFGLAFGLLQQFISEFMLSYAFFITLYTNILKYLKVLLDSHIFIFSVYNLKTHVLLDNI